MSRCSTGPFLSRVRQLVPVGLSSGVERCPSQPGNAQRIDRFFFAAMAIHGNLVAPCSVTEEEESMSDQKLPPKEQPKSASPAGGGITRRGFLKGAGITAAGTALLEGVQAFHREVPGRHAQRCEGIRPGTFPFTLHINGKERTLSDRTAHHAGRCPAHPAQHDRHQSQSATAASAPDAPYGSTRCPSTAA